MPIRWRMTIFNARAIGAILLLLGGEIHFIVRGARLSGFEDPVKNRAAASHIRARS